MCHYRYVVPEGFLVTINYRSSVLFDGVRLKHIPRIGEILNFNEGLIPEKKEKLISDYGSLRFLVEQVENYVYPFEEFQRFVIFVSPVKAE